MTPGTDPGVTRRAAWRDHMASESHLGLSFPLGGIDRSSEYQLQKPGTTPVAVNVRGVEPSTNRERGGTRLLWRVPLH